MLNRNERKLFKKYFLSTGLLLMVVVAPILWALLPLGYHNLNLDEGIKDNPCFLVGMRMFVGTVLSAAGFVLIWLYLMFKGESRKFFCMLKSGFVSAIKSWKIMMLIAFTYFLAREFEMSKILTFSVGEDACGAGGQECVQDSVVSKTKTPREIFAERYASQQRENFYLKGGVRMVEDVDGREIDSIPIVVPVKNVLHIKDRDKEGKQNSVESRTTGALQDFGYFMGLMLALIFMAKNNFFYALVARLRPKWARTVSVLRSGPMTISGGLFFVCTAFLIIASGLLYISAKEPLYVWGVYLWQMLLWAALVAFLSNLCTDFRTLGKIFVRDNDSGGEASSTLAAVMGCMIVNIVMCALTMVFAWSWWWFVADKNGATFSGLFGACLDRWIALVIIVGLLGTLVAPVAQLVGVRLHDRIKSAMKQYGVTGDNWLQISEGFEPLFVVAIGAMMPFVANMFPCMNSYYDSEAKLISGVLMAAAVLTVLVISFLKIGETWAEKSVVLRHACYASIRGSSRGPSATATQGELFLRAKKLAILKFQDKRHELKGVKLGLWNTPKDLTVLNSHGAVAAFLRGNTPSSGKGYFYTSMSGAEYFFTQDDPFTNEVLTAQFSWLQKSFPNVKVDSFSYKLKRFCGPSAPWKTDDGKGLKQLACCNDDTAMPFLIEASSLQAAKAFCERWNKFLAVLSQIVESEKVSQRVNVMLLNFRVKQEG